MDYITHDEFVEAQRVYLQKFQGADSSVCIEVLTAHIGLALAKRRVRWFDSNSLEDKDIVKEELVEVRQRLVQFAQLRSLAVLQYNLARELRGLSSSRQGIDARSLIDAVYGSLKRVEAIDVPASDDYTIFTLGQLIAGYWSWIEEHRDAAATGLENLDKALNGGIQPERLMVLLGGPGSGKTTLANQIADRLPRINLQ
jgi:Cdc6-like AAA superfamily ATPase